MEENCRLDGNKLGVCFDTHFLSYLRLIRLRFISVLLGLFLQDFRRELEEKEKNVGRERRSRESGWNVQKKPRLEASSTPNVQDEDDPYDDDINDVRLSFLYYSAYHVIEFCSNLLEGFWFFSATSNIITCFGCRIRMMMRMTQQN